MAVSTTPSKPPPAADDDMIFIARKIREALDTSAAGRRTVTLTLVISEDQINCFIGNTRGQHWRRGRR